MDHTDTAGHVNGDYWIHHVAICYDITDGITGHVNVFNVIDCDPPLPTNENAFREFNVLGRYVQVGVTGRS